MAPSDRTGLHSQPSLRTCVGCRGVDSRSALLRVIAVENDGAVALRLDLMRRLPGRGAWLHPDLDCLELAIRRRALPRALRVTTGDYSDLREAFNRITHP